MSDQLQMFQESELSGPILSPLEVLAKILVWLEKEKGWTEKEVCLSWKQSGLLLKQNQVFLSEKMLREHLAQTMAQIFGELSLPLPTLGAIDLNGNCLIQVGFYPKIGSGFTLSDILQTEVGQEYFLSQKTIHGLLKGQSKPELVEP